MRRRAIGSIAVLPSVILLLLTAQPAFAAYSTQVRVFKIQDDKFSKMMSVSGWPESYIKMFGTTRFWNLRSWINKQTLEVKHQLVVSIHYSGDWKFYEGASDDGANELKFTMIDRNAASCGGFSGCNLTEDVGAEVDDGLLRERALTGFQVKFVAKSGDSLIIDVTPAQIQSELLTINQVLPEGRKWQPPAVAATPSTGATGSAAQLPAQAISATSTQSAPASVTAPTLAPASKPTVADLVGPPWGPEAFSSPISLVDSGATASLATLQAKLESKGWRLAPSDMAKGELNTEFRDLLLDGAQVDCGRMFGIPYIIDRRAKTQVALKIVLGAQESSLVVGVRGYMRTGMGAKDKTLTCTPKPELAMRLAQGLGEGEIASPPQAH